MSWQRDRAERDALIFEQLKERQALQDDIKKQRAIVQRELMLLREDIANQRTPEGPDPERGLTREERQRRRSRRHSRFDLS